MSSFSRTYGIERVLHEEKFHEIALQWCDDHNYVFDVQMDSLNEVDSYFKNIYENWEE
jgi:hypothetical protein